MSRAHDLLAKRNLESNLLARLDDLERRAGGKRLVVSERWGGSLPGGSPLPVGDLIDPPETPPVGAPRTPSPLPLSVISPDLGLMQAGEFRSGNGAPPGEGFSGTRMGYPGFVYSGETWNIAGVENDTLQFGLRASDGAALAGGGAVVLDADGIKLGSGNANENKITWWESFGDSEELFAINAVTQSPGANQSGEATVAVRGTSTRTNSSLLHLRADMVNIIPIDDVKAGGAPNYVLAITPHDSTNGYGAGNEVSTLWVQGATKTWQTGAITLQRDTSFFTSTYAFAAASTITNTATVYIEGAPSAGANATITNPYALWVGAGRNRFDDSHTTTTPQIEIVQASSGDAALRLALGTTRSYIVGIDNSASDAFVIATAASGAAVLGTGNLVSISTAGAMTVTGDVQTTGAYVTAAADIAARIHSTHATSARDWLWQVVGSVDGRMRLYDNTAGAERLAIYSTGRVQVFQEIELDGALNHDGSTIGFFGVTPASRATTYTVTNLTTDRAYDANSTSTAELADVLGTLIADLRTYGLVT